MSEQKTLLSTSVLPIVKSQLAVECESTMDEGGIAKILSVQAFPRISGHEMLEGESTFDGVLLMKLFVLCQDGFAKTVTTQHKFNGKITSKEVNSFSKGSFKASCSDCRISSVSEKGAKILCSIEVNAAVYNAKEIQVASAESGFEIKEKMIETWALNNLQYVEIPFQAEINIPAADARVISFTSDSVVKSTMSNSGFVVVKGNVFGRILFTNGEEGEIQTAGFNIPFTEEIEIAGATKDGFGQAFTSSLEDKLKISLLQEKNDAKAMIETDIGLNIKSFEKQTAYAIDDIYSTTKDIKTTESAFESIVPCGELSFDKKIDGNIMLDDGTARVSKLVAISAPFIGALQSKQKDGKFSLIGIAYANILYESDDEENKINSVQIEIPFEVDEDFDKTMKITEFEAVLDEVDISVKKGRTVFFDAKIKAHATLCQMQSQTCVTSIVTLGDVKAPESAIEIIFAKKGTSLWENAKKLAAPVDQILEQNPTLMDPLEKDEKIVLYHRNVLSFD